jgi:hypothetical protein
MSTNSKPIDVLWLDKSEEWRKRHKQATEIAKMTAYRMKALKRIEKVQKEGEAQRHKRRLNDLSLSYFEHESMKEVKRSPKLENEEPVVVRGSLGWIQRDSLQGRVNSLLAEIFQAR